ncbi:MAG: outer membrane beta-barrel protein [Alphaproteobacteria bacterium]|nr:outer membrane beta-barrel protein [Alphaproteobacteria bacterium]
MKQALVACTLLLTVPGAANAANGIEKYFDGFFAGIETGISHDSGQPKDRWYNANDTNLYYGVLAGYRLQLDSGFVFGLEAALGDTTYKNKARPIDCTDCGFFDAIGLDNNWVADYSADYGWSLSGTLGHTFGVGQKNLIFAKAGYIKLHNGSDIPEGDAFIYGNESGEIFEVRNPNDSGLILGGGYERAITGKLRFRISADYVDLGKNDPLLFDGVINKRFSGTEQYQGKVGLIFQF